METKEFKSKYECPVYIIEGDKIKEITMKEYLETYWNDETTTPEGLANRTQVRAILVSKNGKLLDYSHCEDSLDPEHYEEDGWIPEVKWGTFTWSGAWGNHPFKWNGDEYDSWDEAYETILDGFYHDFLTLSSNVPIAYETFEEAKEVLKEKTFFEKYGYYPSKREMNSLTLEDIINDDE